MLPWFILLVAASGVADWTVSERVDPMTDAKVTAAMRADAKAEAVLSFVCDGGERSTLSVRLVSPGKVQSRHSEAKVMLRYDAAEPTGDLWEVDRSGVLFVQHRPHLEKVMAEILKARRLRVRLQMADNEQADYDFDLGNARSALATVSGVCAAKPPPK